MQHDIPVLLDGRSGWAEPGPEASLQAGSSSVPSGGLRGQAHLKEALRTDPRISLRIRVSLLLFGAALVTDIVNQLSPAAVSMPTSHFWVTIGAVIATLLLIALVYPRLGIKRFFIVEQLVLTFASLLIVYQVSTTNAEASPYMIWFLLTSYYAAYLMPARQALFNVAWFTFLIITVAVTSEAHADAYHLENAALVITIWSITLALVNLRGRENLFERAVAFLSLADPLTSCANMRAFEQHLEQLIRSDGRQFTVVVADLNGLKGVNTVFGHDVGDEMIRRTAALLRSTSNDTDQVARFGGDEFAVVMPASSEAALTGWQDELEAAIERHNISVRGRFPQISLAVGGAVFPQDGLRPHELIDAADQRMYAHKQSVVAAPHEVDGESAADLGRAFAAARRAEPPRQPIDTNDRLRVGAVNWLAGAVLALSVPFIGGVPAHGVPAAAAGVFALLMAAFTALQRGGWFDLRKLWLIDIATLVFPLPAIWATGSATSPLLVTLILPVALYAQTFEARQAWPRIIILVLGGSVGFLAFGGIGAVENTYFFTVLAAILVVAAVIQYSSGRQRAALATIQASARIDRLTGLPNIHALKFDLQRALRDESARGSGRQLGLVVVDLDDFRRANTLAGHSGGDDVLRSVAEKLRAAADGRRVYRIGGDDFALLAKDLSESDLRALAEQSAEAAGDEHSLGSTVIRIGASSGSAHWREGQGADELIEAAEASLRAHKQRRRREPPPSRQILL